MAKSRGIRRIAQVQPILTGDPATDRATGEVAQKVNAIARGPVAQSIPLEAHLEWGLNRIGHGLGVPVREFIVSAVSDPAAVVTSRQAENPVPDRQVWAQLDGPAAEATALLILLPVVT